MSAAFPWLENCRGAVSLTFDDGMTSQLQLAIPMLNDHGLRGTFYVNPRGDNWQERMAPWNEAARAGHEIGNHTMAHPCSRAFRDSSELGALESLTSAELEADVVEAERRLNSAILTQKERSFCYPCYQDFVGEGGARQSYVPVIARHFIAARAKGEVANHPATCTLHHLSSWPAERCWGATLVGLAERAATQGRWTILTFHGINQGHLSVSEVDLKELLDHLSAHRERIWTAPVIEVAHSITAWRQRQVG
jgi:peptidoglycan/xylan/chitin deacetylase (PgdA/CDA1 family)